MPPELQREERWRSAHLRVTRVRVSESESFAVAEVGGDNRLAALRELGKVHRSGILSGDGAAYWRDKINSSIQMHVPSGARTIARGFSELYMRRGRLTGGEWNDLLAFTEGLGFTQAQLRRMVWTPDYGSYAAGVLASKSCDHSRFPPPEPPIPTIGGIHMGCTSIVRRSANGIGWSRNLDFAGVGTWDRLPMLVVYKSGAVDAPGWERMGFATEGLPLAGITGLNQRGVYLALHQHYSVDHTRRGLPVALAGERVLRQASSLEEARELLADPANRPAGLWALLIGHLPSRTFSVFEVSQRVFEEHSVDGEAFAWANTLQSSSAIDHQRLSFGTYQNSELRRAFAREGAERLSADHDWLPMLLELTGHYADPGGELATARDVVKPHTILTVGLQEKRGQWDAMWGISKAPTATGRFIRFDPNLMASDPLSCPVSVWKHPVSVEARKAQETISEAYRLVDDEGDLAGAYALLRAQQTECARIFLATVLVALPTLDPPALHELAELADSGRSSEAESCEELRLLSALAIWRIRGRVAARDELRKFLDSRPANPTCESVARKGLRARRCPRPTYNFFSGSLF